MRIEKNFVYLLHQITTTMAKKELFRLLSPDGIDIRHDKSTYGRNEVKNELQAFADRYKRQGYYSSMRGRIPLEDIVDCCEVVPC